MAIATLSLRSAGRSDRLARVRFAAALLALCFALTLAGCGEEERGDARFGEPCASDSECAAGLCVGGVDGDAPRCTRSCATGTQCPQGWSCSGVTEAGVVVCQKGRATPF